jgi:hypothetical protein
MYQRLIVFLCLMLFAFNSLHAQDSISKANLAQQSLVNAPFQKIDSIQIQLAYFQTKSGLTDFNYQSLAVKQIHFSDTNNYITRKGSKDWLSFLLIGIIILFAFVNTGHGKIVLSIFQAYWSNRLISQFNRDDNFFKLRTSAFFLLIFLFVLSLLIFNASPFYATAIKFKGIALYARIFFLVTSYYLLKYLLLKMAASLFAIKKIIAAHLSIMAISNFVYVMAILPILLFYQFLPKAAHQNLIYLMIFLWVLNAIYKYLRSGAYVSSNFRFPKFYLFIYLCSLELMPLLFIYKIIMGFRN